MLSVIVTTAIISHYSYYLAELMWHYKHHSDDPFWAILDDIKKVYNLNKINK